MTISRRTSDPAQADRVWFGYHPRAMAPTGAAVAVVSFLVWLGRWYQEDLLVLADRFGPLVVFAVVWGAWLVLGAVFVYRTVTYTYRLTDRALVVDFGFWFRPVPEVALDALVEVRAGAGLLGRALGVGWVEVRTANRSVRLTGVRRPFGVEKQILAAVSACRDR